MSPKPCSTVSRAARPTYSARVDPCYDICYSYEHTSNNGNEGDYSISKATRLNGTIQATELRVIDEDGKQLGILSKYDALRLAEERELDLVEISPDAKPPVAKIVDWGKYNYQRTKQLQRNKKNARSPEMKQMRFGLKIGEHDLGVKLGKVSGFLEEGHKVKLTVVYRGRELAHKELGFKLADKIVAELGDKVVVDQSPQFAGKQLNLVVHSNPSARRTQPTQS
jgi:translation initiation factor IF-3